MRSGTWLSFCCGPVVGAALLLACHPQGPPERPDRAGRQPETVAPLALTRAMVIVQPGRVPLHAGTVVLRNGRVAAVFGPEAPVPSDALAIDVGGGWVVPSGLPAAVRPPAEALPVDRAPTSVLTAGQPADVLVWSRDPRDPRAVLEQAYVGGRLVLRRPPGLVGDAGAESQGGSK